MFFFILLINLLDQYNISLTQIGPNFVRTVIAFQLFCDKNKVRWIVTLFRMFFMLKSSSTAGWYAFSSYRLSLKVKALFKNAYWKDKFFFVRFLSFAPICHWWNLRGIHDKIDLSAIDPGFDALEGFGRTCKLSQKFDEGVLVYTGLGQSQLDDDSEDVRDAGICPWLGNLKGCSKWLTY